MKKNFKIKFLEKRFFYWDEFFFHKSTIIELQSSKICDREDFSFWGMIFSRKNRFSRFDYTEVYFSSWNEIVTLCKIRFNKNFHLLTWKISFESLHKNYNNSEKKFFAQKQKTRVQLNRFRNIIPSFLVKIKCRPVRLDRMQMESV